MPPRVFQTLGHPHSLIQNTTSSTRAVQRGAQLHLSRRIQRLRASLLPHKHEGVRRGPRHAKCSFAQSRRRPRHES
eukprot:scaffold568_cov233-Pinguiococcus_pyrenoidosus.AAC.8